MKCGGNPVGSDCNPSAPKGIPYDPQECEEMLGLG